jgi:hypothetical protein
MKDKTLESCLAEVDERKAIVSSRHLPLTPEERAAAEKKGLARLEAQLDRKLRRTTRRRAKAGSPKR